MFLDILEKSVRSKSIKIVPKLRVIISELTDLKKHMNRSCEVLKESKSYWWTSIIESWDHMKTVNMINRLLLDRIW